MWTLDPAAALPLWRPAEGSGGPAVPARALLAFSTRRGGVSLPPYDSLNLGRSVGDSAPAVDENRDRLLGALGLSSDRLATAGQVHGTEAVAAPAPGHYPNCDILLTRVPGLALAVSCADCMPLLLVAPGAVAAAHSGWRGTDAGAPSAALAALCESAGILPQQVRAHIGPCIRSCCYVVGPEVAKRFPAAAVRRAGEAWYLDLPAAARLQLLAAGVPEGAVEDTGACTACDGALYYSHRRDAGRTGRHWGVVALEP